MVVGMSRLSAPDLAPATPGHRVWMDTGALQQRFRDHLDSGTTRELWKYTPLAGFMEAMPPAENAAALELSGLDQPGVRALPFAEMTEQDVQEVRQLVAQRLDAPRHLLADLCLLRAPRGWLIEVTGTLREPLAIRYGSGGNVPLVVLVRSNARAELVETVETGESLAQVCVADLERDAALIHHRAALQGEGQHWALQQVRLSVNASYELGQHLLGGRRRRSETHVILDGRGAQATMKGAYVVEDGQHLDQQITVEHRVGDTRSHQTFHGIGCGKGRSIFNGRIHIHPHAPRSDASLTNRNLAMHREAEMNCKPELEIYTDDVRCAHGATVGQLSEDALFYLQSRGVPHGQAKKLLSHGFLRECLEGPLAETSATRFLRALG